MKQLESLTSKMLIFLNSQSKEDVMTMAQLARNLNILEINLFKLAEYMEKTDLCKKFHGFYMRLQKEVINSKNRKIHFKKLRKIPQKQKQIFKKN